MILDILLVLLLILVLFIGYKVGFLTRFLKMASTVLGLVFAVLFCGEFAKFLAYVGVQAPIQEKIYQNIITDDAFQTFQDSEHTAETLSHFFKELGLPKFIADVAGSGLSEQLQPLDIAHSVSQSIAHIVVVFLAFLILLIGGTLIVWVLKQVVKLLRKGVPLFRVVDGILGIVFSAALYFLVLYLLLFLLSLYLQLGTQDGMIEKFICGQLKMDSNQFGLAKYFYENNILGNLLKLIF